MVMIMMVIMVPGIADKMIMVMVDWIRFQVMVDYWFDVFMVMVHWIRMVVMVMVQFSRMLVSMVDCLRMVMMVTYLVIVMTWWMPVFDVLVYFVVWYHAPFILLFVITKMTMVHVWVTMMNVKMMNWPVMLVEMSLCMMMVMLMVNKDMLWSVVLMVDYRNAMRVTI